MFDERGHGAGAGIDGQPRQQRLIDGGRAARQLEGLEFAGDVFVNLELA